MALAARASGRASNPARARRGRRATLRLLGGGGGALAGALALPPAAPAEGEASAAVSVEPLAGGMSPTDVPARIDLALRTSAGAPVRWDALEPFAMPGAKKHAVHVHLYDDEDEDIPGIEVGHVHPEEFGDVKGVRDGVFPVVFDFPHPGRFTVEVSWKPKGEQIVTRRVGVALSSKMETGEEE